jgi:isoleucyl-tRNA synthetase
MKFAQNGTLYRGSKPVMWSVVEKTALAEAEVEYEDYVSDQVWVKFPVRTSTTGTSPTNRKLASAAILIWTTTPWTIPGNRAISFSPKTEYGLYEVLDAPAGNWAKPGDRFVLADKLAADVFRQARVNAYNRLSDVAAADLSELAADHPLKAFNAGYDFPVPLLAGDHVTDDVGTGFVHTAPGHGREDFEVWTGNAAKLAARGVNTAIPYTVDADGRFTDHAPGFIGKRVLTDKGEKGDANEAVIKALIDAGMLLARGRLKHQYPHSWRSKKPVIFRNTPHWFIVMDKDIADARPRARSDQSHPLGASARGEPHHRHGREQARLGALPPARLGRADHGIHPREGRRLGRTPQRRARQQAHRRRLRAGRRRRLVRDRRRRAFPQARLRFQRVAEGRRHSRRLVRFRFHARVRAGRP